MARVSEEQLAHYLQNHLDAYLETAKEIPDDARSMLLRLSKLPARIEGIISLTYGIAIEYTPADENLITTRTGFRSIEDLLFHPPARVQRMSAVMRLTDSKNVVFDHVTFEGGYPLRVGGDSNNITLADVRALARGWDKYIHYAVIYGNSDSNFWSLERAVADAKDEMLQAVIHAKRAQELSLSIPNFLRRSKEKDVLVLGSYSEQGEQKIRLLAKSLEEIGYTPLILKDLPDHPEMNLTQKAQAYGALSRFIIVEDSEPSGHLTELQALRSQEWVIVILRSTGEVSTFMTKGASISSKPTNEFEYSQNNVSEVLNRAAAWAEDQIKKSAGEYLKVYPWRDI